jgi:hypothetical protein
MGKRPLNILTSSKRALLFISLSTSKTTNEKKRIRITALTTTSRADHGTGQKSGKNIRDNGKQKAKTHPHRKPLNQVANTIGKRKKMGK